MKINDNNGEGYNNGSGNQKSDENGITMIMENAFEGQSDAYDEELD